MIIDAWMQHPNAEWIGNPMFESHPCRDGSCRRLRRYALRVARSERSDDQPDRFVGIASVDLFRPMDAVRKLRLRVKRDAFKGLRVLPWLWGLPPDDRRYYPLFAECCELDIPFCTQVGARRPFARVGARAAHPYLDRVALDFPELRILAGHISVPWLSEMLSLVMKYPNIFIDTSAYKISRYPSELCEYMRGNSKHRVLFGSNHPFWPASECIAGLDGLNMGEAAQSAFLTDNARRLFKLA
jgi:predicted TIM-barrel fold metal-dependent hydrolase